MERADIAIIGTGPGGVSAAITSKVRGKRVLLFGQKRLSDKMVKAHAIQNYPGLPAVKGADLAKAMQDHLKAMDIEITEKQVTAVYAMGDYYGIQTPDEMYEATAVILATGVVMSKTFPGEDELLGRGVSYCATCDAFLYRGKTAAVIGYNEESCEEADFLAETCKEVLYFPAVPHEVKVSDRVKVINEKPIGILGEGQAAGVRTETGSYAADGVFVLRDAVAPDKLVPGLETDGAHIKVDLEMKTNLPGLFACGDVAGKPYQYIKAAGQGNVAALSAVSYLSAK